MENIFWALYCNEQRHTGINNIQSAVLKYGNVIDFKFFSDISISMIVEIKEFKIDSLYEELKKIVGIDNFELLHSNSQKERTIFLNVIFKNATGDLKIEVPEVPG